MSPTGKPANGDSTPKVPRKRVAPKHLLDGSNSEAPNAAHQSIVNETQARLTAASAIATLIRAIEDLDAALPTTIAEGTDEDEIHRVLTTIHGPDDGSRAASSTFNRRFDVLFKEDAQCRVNGRLHLIRRGELGMLMVVRYLRDTKWNDPEMNLDGAVNKLERIVKEMEVLAGIDRLAARKAANAHKAASTSTSKQKGKNPAPQTNTVPAQPTNPAKEAMYDRLFTSVMAGRNGKSDNNYKPRNNKGDLSEEEDDDFMDVNEDAASTSNITKKRKIIVVDGVLPAPPTKKKVKKSSAPVPPPPDVDVIEIDDESEDEICPGGKRGPKSQTRDHFWPPAATNHKGDRRWSFVCRHCKASVTFKRKVDKTQLFGDEKPAPALGNLATHYKDHHQGVPVPADVPSGESRGISATSAKIMADFLVDGKLNPAINSSQKNFYKIFFKCTPSLRRVSSIVAAGDNLQGNAHENVAQGWAS